MSTFNLPLPKVPENVLLFFDRHQTINIDRVHDDRSQYNQFLEFRALLHQVSMRGGTSTRSLEKSQGKGIEINE